MQCYCCLVQFPAVPMSCMRWIWPCVARILACIYIYIDIYLFIGLCIVNKHLYHYIYIYIYIFRLYMPNKKPFTSIYEFYTYAFQPLSGRFHALYILYVSFWHVLNVLSYITQGPLQPLQPPDHVSEQMMMDLITQLPCTSSGFDSVYIFINCLQKYIYLVLCKEPISAPELAQLFLSTVIAYHGIPSCYSIKA